jgi:glycosyl transferase, family 25
MRVNQLVGGVFVLSVRSFTDRIAHMRAEMARHGIDFEFIFEFDANAIPPALIDSTFGPSDLSRAQQSLVLKHLHAQRLCIERGLERVLVFEDDAVLDPDFAAGFATAMQEADRLPPGYLIYLGRGNNQYLGVGTAERALVAGGLLPATDALVFDRTSASRRLEYVAAHPVVRPADWLLREVDAALGIPHYWLHRPLVEQGSMNGRFDSVLDTRRQQRGRRVAGLLYRWRAFWKALARDLGRWRVR